MMSGTIFFYSDEHDVLKVREFYTKGQLNGLIGNWCENHESGYYQIALQWFDRNEKRPYVKPTLMENITRPAARYTNIPIYDYHEKKNGEGH